jgi:hypothetical protein
MGPIGQMMVHLLSVKGLNDHGLPEFQRTIECERRLMSQLSEPTTLID